MERHLIEKKPTWWLLYAIGATLVGLVGLLEHSVAGEAARLMLELGSVAGMLVLALCWLRVNRGRIELAEVPATRPHAFGTVVQVPARRVNNPSKSPRDGGNSLNVA